MSLAVVTIQFTQEKTCFVALSQNVVNTANHSGRSMTQDVKTFLVDDRVYVSWSGDVVRNTHGTDGVLHINGLFAAKVGLKDESQVIVRPVLTVATCVRCSVEPLSYDDWEILDRHSSFIESHLLDMVRVIQADQVYPVWVEKSVCVFIKIGSTNPTADCVLLVNETEVDVAPKVRSSAIGQPVAHEPITKSVSADLSVPFIQQPDTSEEDLYDTKFRSVDSDTMKDMIQNMKADRKIREKSPMDNISSQWKSLFSYLGLRRSSVSDNGLVGRSEYEDEDDFLEEGDLFSQSEPVLQTGLNLVLRVQSLKYTPTESDRNGEDFSPPHRRNSDSPRKGGGSSPRKSSRESPSRSNRSSSLPKSNFKLNYFPQQVSTVYMDKSDIEKQIKYSRCDIPNVFYAKIRKLRSPQQQQQQQQQLQNKSGNLRSGQLKKQDTTSSDSEKTSPLSETPDSSTPTSGPVTDSDLFCVVRVIVIDKRRQLCNDQYTAIIQRVLREQPLIKGHVIIPDMLRRYLKLDVTSRVWLQTFKGEPSSPAAFTLHPLGNIPKSLSSDSGKINMAFREWLNQVSIEDYPMVVYSGIFLRFLVLPGTYLEAQLTYKEVENTAKCIYTLLHPGVLRNVNLSISLGGRTASDTSQVIQPMLAYTSVSSIDPPLSNARLECIGGMSEIIDTAMSNIEICLGSRRLYRELFLTTPGLLNGMLLLTGPKGSGKTTLAKALCKKVTELPNMAYVHPVDCKPLRGKKVDTIQKTFELLFDEAVWRQPSLILLDDLDHLCGAPAGPEFEMTGEALYAARVAEVLKDLLRKDIRNMSKIAVLATCQSRSLLHPILVSSRGTHLVQEVMCIKPLNKEQRADILEKILKTKSMVTEEALSKLDLTQLSQRTEGFVARDLENIINRAVHANILAQGRAIQEDTQLDIKQEDFETALKGFTPASIRNVPLHEAGELGWSDIGGLTDVKETLIETLQWPTKYPALFADCPLRLRSGLLLYGAPGTGKTLLAGVVAKECGLNFISIKGPELLSKYIGASEQAVRDTFLRAQSAKPCILFFDEFDSIAPRRGHDNTGVTDRVVNQLLTQLDGVEGLDGVYVLAATSRPDLIDPALLRPGRLDKCLLCKLPDKDERLCIMKALSRTMSLDNDINMEYFAETCEDFTGADFKALLYNAQLEAIHEFTSATDEGESEQPRFGMKAKKGLSNRLKSKSAKLKVDVKKRERHRSFASGTVAYVPNLTEGIIQVSAEMEERLHTQISQIRLRERRQSDQFVDIVPDSPFQMKNLLVVTQKHLLSALSKMRPSVSGEERLKYQRIYENFVSSRGGHFDTGFMEAAENLKLKATLA